MRVLPSENTVEDFLEHSFRKAVPLMRVYFNYLNQIDIFNVLAHILQAQGLPRDKKKNYQIRDCYFHHYLCPYTYFLHKKACAQCYSGQLFCELFSVFQLF